MNKMNGVYRHTMLLILFMVSTLINEGYAQSIDDSAYAALAKSRPEKLLVFTDRSLYAVNESIRFSATLQSGTGSLPGPGSEVIYIELVNASGEAVAKGKYSLSENRSSGQLSIPSTTASGNYYLRSYTRWMRNFGAANFTYLPIRVVNPYSKNMEDGRWEPGKPGLSIKPKDHPAVICSTNKTSYGAGEMVHAEFIPMGDSMYQIQNGCMTVVPEGSIDTSALLYRVDVKPDSRVPFELKFLPDRNGTAISGTVMNGLKGAPSPHTRIHFSILGKDPAYLVTASDQEGRFLIKIPPRTGNQEMFVVPEPTPGNPLQVLIDNDFSSEPLPFQAEPYTLNDEEKLLASRISLQMQLQQNYLVESETDSSMMDQQAGHIPFYGEPVISVKIDEFINLPNMEEVIINLVSQTYVMRRGDREYFMIKSENPMISNYNPLILIDHIPVFDMNVVLAIPPSKIDHIEVIPEVYILGEEKYGGIICFTSREGDLAGMKLPEGSYFFDFTALQAPMVELHPRYPGGSRIPDTRNTIFWVDHMELQQDRATKISFPAGSIPGNYLILFRGVSSNGNMVYGSNHIQVR
jgi:hypothetical protein